MAEAIGTGGKFHQRLIGGAIWWEDGFTRTLDAPGLGIAFQKQLAGASVYRHRPAPGDAGRPCKYSELNLFRGGAPAKED